jgi:thiamine biosynthesis lipoprotein
MSAIAALAANPTRAELRVSRTAMACEFCAVFPGSTRNAFDAGCAALDEIDRLEALLSAYRPDSVVSRLNGFAARGPVPVDAELFTLLETGARISHETNGAFDIAAGTLIKAWGFFRGPKRVPSEDELAAALASSGSAHVLLDPAARTVLFRRPVELNLGAIGKGYAIDRAAAVLRSEFHVRAALINGGHSSIRAIGAPPGSPAGWSVALADPFRPGRTLLAVLLRDRALGTSGAAHQFFVAGGRRYGHILDPRTGRPAAALASATVLAPTAAEADALSTAFFAMGLVEARQYCRTHPGTAAVLVTLPQPRRAPEIVTLGQVEVQQ